jgi:hypothetical protein
MTNLNLKDFIFSDHALRQIDRRGILLDEISSALADPQEIIPVEEKRIIVQNIISALRVGTIY